jgi:hypothetical protein
MPQRWSSDPSPIQQRESTVSGTLVELDDRRRLSLGKVGRHSRYLVREEPDGTLIFEPAVVMTEFEARFLAHPKLVAQIAENAAHPERRRVRRRRG